MCRGTLQKVKVRGNDRLDMREKQVGKKIEFQVYIDWRNGNYANLMRKG